MRFLILTIFLECICCITIQAQVIPGMPDLPVISAESDGPGSVVGIDPGIINPDIPPAFPGGTDSLITYLKRNLKLPILKSDNKKIYGLIVGINIDSCGNVSVAHTYWESDEEWAEMAKRIKGSIARMPKWIPRMSYDRKQRLKSFEAFEFFAQNNHLVIEIYQKHLKIY
ncbi:hypothetical protein [Chitinophaga silvisoli]|uniref:TonB C-terminal domain-containing protein n=1 Tax=Chitinophaga silvisoli TaxID=2291814 RepID=A0A3E1NMU5_9BACT|nr:hypothetical protein [Chitinophaga silvisoli]RFM29250.1 hypothetical protein DXN04_33750 [Chitinophaga silvisoli]